MTTTTTINILDLADEALAAYVPDYDRLMKTDSIRNRAISYAREAGHTVIRFGEPLADSVVSYVRAAFAYYYGVEGATYPHQG